MRITIDAARQTGLVVMVIMAFIGFMCTLAHSQQPHIHGIQGIPDWYDPNCCNRRDCRPVEDKEVEFFEQGGSDWVRHIPTGIMFQRSQWRISQDERYHVCIHTEGVGWDGNFSVRGLCVYIRTGA